jgi:hypothetical protein
MHSSSVLLRRLTLFVILFQPAWLCAQRSAFGANPEAPSAEAIKSGVVSAAEVQPDKVKPHLFWDGKNRALFGSVAVLGVADFFVTRTNLSAGGRELNPMARIWGRSNAGLAINISLQTGAILGASYLFHRKGHHKMERFTSLVNIAGSASAVSYGLVHR